MANPAPNPDARPESRQVLSTMRARRLAPRYVTKGQGHESSR